MKDEALRKFLERHPMSRYDPQRQYPELQWLIAGLWLGGGKINGLFGMPKAGKSRLLGWGLVSLLSGTSFMDELPVGQLLPRKMLYVHAEEDEAAITNRMRGYAAALGVSDEGWSDRLVFMPGMNMGLNDPGNRAQLNKVIRLFRPDLMVIDPYIRVHGAKEQDAQEMARIHNDFRAWTQQDGLDIVLLHHTGKVPDEVNMELDISRWARGSSDIAAMLDAGVYVRRVKPDQIKLYRTGRYAPLPELLIRDRGDNEPWKRIKVTKRKGRTTGDPDLDSA